MTRLQLERAAYRSEGCLMARVAGGSCGVVPRPLDWPHFKKAVMQSAHRLKLAEDEFTSKVRSFRYDACKKIGYLCQIEPTAPMAILLENLPATDLDGPIQEALRLLPNTSQILADLFDHYLNQLKMTATREGPA